MRCFDVLRDVIQASLYSLTNEETSRLGQAIGALEYLYNRLEENDPADQRPDFDDPVVRVAYLYKYVAFNAAVLAEVFSLVPDLVKPLFAQPDLTVVCLGGGPGSEIIGLSKYLTQQKPAGFQHLSVILVDRCGGWSNDWLRVTSRGIADGPWRITSAYASPTDVCQASSQRLVRSFSGARLYTSLYFLSELLNDKDRAAPFLATTFAKADPGSVFFFLDNRRNVQYEWVFPLLTDAGWNVAKHWTGEWVLDSDEEKQTLANFKPLMKNHDPRVQGRIAWGIAVKG